MLAVTGPDVLVTYEHSGGFAGIQEKVTVNTSGTALVNDRKVPLDSAEMRGLRHALRRVVTTRSSAAGCDVADHFTYTLTYRGHRTTRCTLPSDWRAAVERLEALFAFAVPSASGAGAPSFNGHCVRSLHRSGSPRGSLRDQVSRFA